MDSKKIEEKILKEITKKFEGMPGIKVVSVLPELTKNIYANLVKDVQYLKHFSESELKEEIGVFVSSLFREVQLTEEEYQEKIENFTKNLGTEKEVVSLYCCKISGHSIQRDHLILHR
jgi:YesN/AraC family two-component response regulator